MDFCKIAEQLGISAYPAALERYWPIPQDRSDALCSAEMIHRLQQRFDLFGEYFQAVLEGFADLKNDSLRKAYLDVVSLYIQDATLAEIQKLPYPPNENTPASNMLPLLVHLPSVEAAYETYRSRGFDHGQALSSLQVYRIYLWEMVQHRAGFVGFTPDLSRWVSQFTMGLMFYPGLGGINFQPIALAPGQSPYYLENKTTGELLPVFGAGTTFHRSGLPLGSVGAEDPAGSFTPVFEETADAYWGNAVRNCLVCPQREAFPKADWALVLRPGDNVLATHIFFGSDFTPETLDLAMGQGWELALQCYPEYDLKAQYCKSWLLSPAIEESLGKTSKVSMFGARFVKFPVQSNGQAVFDFVFPGQDKTPETLPENTSLQRAIKKKLLGGGHIYVTAGIRRSKHV